MLMFNRRFKLAAWRSISVLLDLAVAWASFYGAYVIVYDTTALNFVPALWKNASAFTGLCAIALFIFEVHRGTWRYVSLPDVLNLVKTAAATVAIYTVGAFLVSRGTHIPRSVIVLSGLLLVVGLVTPRLVYRLAVEGHWLNPLGGRRPEEGARNVLILGLTSTAESFIRAWRRTRQSQFYVAGILDSAESSRKELVQGVKVVGSFGDLAEVIERFEKRGTPLTELVIAENSPSRQRLSDIVQRATAAGLKVTRIPDLTDPAALTSATLMDPKPIELRDLLGRAEVETDINSVATLISGRCVLATGAGGSIGSELVRQIAQFRPRQLVLTDNSEYNTYMLDKEIREAYPDLNVVTRLVSVRDKARLRELFLRCRPDVVFHAAALKHVPLVQENPIEGIKTNVLGTRNVVDAAIENDVSTFIMISTDKAVNPTNVMGATKRAAEAYCQTMDLSISQKTRFKTVRFGNVLGSNGSVVPRFQEQIAAGGPVTVTHPNIVRYFMTIPEAVRLVLHATAHGLNAQSERGKITVLDMGDPVRIVDLAERMIQLAGFKPNADIDIVFSGLRPGEKLYEELFDPSEVQDATTKDGYVVANPRVVDSAFLMRALDGIEAAVLAEDEKRALELLRNIVPEYKDSTADLASKVQVARDMEVRAI